MKHSIVLFTLIVTFSSFQNVFGSSKSAERGQPLSTEQVEKIRTELDPHRLALTQVAHTLADNLVNSVLLASVENHYDHINALVVRQDKHQQDVEKLTDEQNKYATQVAIFARQLSELQAQVRVLQQLPPKEQPGNGCC
jgi:hypothetical protein